MSALIWVVFCEVSLGFIQLIITYFQRQKASLSFWEVITQKFLNRQLTVVNCKLYIVN